MQNLKLQVHVPQTIRQVMQRIVPDRQQDYLDHSTVMDVEILDTTNSVVHMRVLEVQLVSLHGNHSL